MRDDASRPQIGGIFAGKYLLTSRIGTGQSSLVFAARHYVTGKRFAIRWFIAGHDDAGSFLARAHEVVGHFRHPNVLEVYDVGELAGSMYTVLEWSEGVSLEARCGREKLSVPEAGRLLIPCMRGIHDAHVASIVHGDLKLSNIFLFQATKTTPDIAKVLDFEVDELTRPSASSATAPRGKGAQFRAPELSDGFPADFRSDVYAFGAILERVLTGPASSQPARLPDDVTEIVARATARDPDQRFQTLADLADAFESCARLNARAEGPRKTHFAADTLLQADVHVPSPFDTQFSSETSATAHASSPTRKRAYIAAVATLAFAVAYYLLDADADPVTQFNAAESPDGAAAPLESAASALDLAPTPEPLPLPVVPPIRAAAGSGIPVVPASPEPVRLPLRPWTETPGYKNSPASRARATPVTPMTPATPAPRPRPQGANAPQKATEESAPPSHTEERDRPDVPEMNLL